MSSRGKSGKATAAGMSSTPSNKGKAIEGSTQFDLNQGVADMKLNSAQTDGDWEVYTKKPKNKGGNNNSKGWGSQSANSKGWGQADVGQQNSGARRTSGNAWGNQAVESSRPLGRGNGKHQPSNPSLGNYMVPAQGGVPPALVNGWNWQSRPGAAKAPEVAPPETEYDDDDEQDGSDEDDDEVDEPIEDTDEELMSDEFDSDDSAKSHDTRKKSNWFKKFFELLDSLTLEQINEPDRQWHCPACQNGPGAIDWFKGLQPLMTHARTKGAKRLKLHRELAELLEEEMSRKGTSVFPTGEVFGKWKGLKEEENDYDVVWPPMVMVMNTRLDKDDNDKWTGMGNQELLDYFRQYAAVKAKHSYGPQGHRGMSLLLFETSSRGFFEATRLDGHFTTQGTDRNAWNQKRNWYYPGGKRQLYGFMATKDDIDFFNQHSHGKAKLRYEMRSYNEVVVRDYNRVCNDNEQLTYFKSKVIKEQRNSRALAESLGTVSEKLRKTMEENRIVRQRTALYHEQNKEELDYQEKFFKDQLEHILETRKAKEEEFENRQQEERKKVTGQSSYGSNNGEYRTKVDEVSRFIQLQEKEMEQFVEKRENLVKLHEEKYVLMRRKHWQEEMDLEKEFDAQLTDLMQEYTPQSSGAKA
ncbi:Protein SUPPRESSOR OF GENE SILENCING 3 [Linum grandiflorum]